MVTREELISAFLKEKLTISYGVSSRLHVFDNHSTDFKLKPDGDSFTISVEEDLDDNDNFITHGTPLSKDIPEGIIHKVHEIQEYAMMRLKEKSQEDFEYFDGKIPEARLEGRVLTFTVKVAPKDLRDMLHCISAVSDYGWAYACSMAHCLTNVHAGEMLIG